MSPPAECRACDKFAYCVRLLSPSECVDVFCKYSGNIKEREKLSPCDRAFRQSERTDGSIPREQMPTVLRTLE
jgi:hypothetical protein